MYHPDSMSQNWFCFGFVISYKTAGCELLLLLFFFIKLFILLPISTRLLVTIVQLYWPCEKADVSGDSIFLGTFHTTVSDAGFVVSFLFYILDMIADISTVPLPSFSRNILTGLSIHLESECVKDNTRQAANDKAFSFSIQYFNYIDKKRRSNSNGTNYT